MGWFIGGGIIYVVLLFTCGVLTIRNGHWLLFIIGIIFPFLWLIGAVMRPTARVT